MTRMAPSFTIDQQRNEVLISVFFFMSPFTLLTGFTPSSLLPKMHPLILHKPLQDVDRHRDPHCGPSGLAAHNTGLQCLR
jgi:hypothetical protein